MAYQIRIVPEVDVWLAELRVTDPAAADLVDEALTALRVAGEGLGPPLVVPLDENRQRPSQPDLDYSYERQLHRLTWVRRSVADVATSRKRVELGLERLEEQSARLQDRLDAALRAGQDDLAAAAAERQSVVSEQRGLLSEQYAGLRESEAQMVRTSQRLQARVDSFRARKEAIKAAWLAAEATAEAVRAERDIQDAAARLGDLEPPDGQAEAVPARGAPHALELRELRPGAPGQAGIRLLFTVEAPDIAVLLAAGSAEDMLRAWYAEAVVDCHARYEPDGTG